MQDRLGFDDRTAAGVAVVVRRAVKLLATAAIVWAAAGALVLGFVN